jgi:hypothetical protein
MKLTSFLFWKTVIFIGITLYLVYNKSRNSGKGKSLRGNYTCFEFRVIDLEIAEKRTTVQTRNDYFLN